MTSIDDLMVKVSELLAWVSALLGRRDNTQREFQDWFGGAADGGPAGDGLFPLTDSTGYIRMVPSPARQMQDVASGGLQFGALPIATEAEIVPEEVQYVGCAHAGGAAKKLSPHIVDLKRRTALPQLQLDFGTDVFMSVVQGGNLERKIALAEIQRKFSGGVINPKMPPYNCKGDALEVRSAYMAKDSNVVEIKDALFRPGDVGKWLSMSNGRSHPQYYSVPKHFTITRYIDAYHVEVDDVAEVWWGATQACLWGTDDTEGMQRALDDARGPSYNGDNTGKWYYGGTVLVPPGMYLCRSLTYRSHAALIGSGFSNTVIVHRPNTNVEGQGAQPPLLANEPGSSHPFIQNMSLYGSRYHQYEGSEATLRWSIPSTPGQDLGSGYGDPYPFFSFLRLYDAAGDALRTMGRHSGNHIGVDIFNAQGFGWKNSSYDVNAMNFLAIGCGYSGYLGGEIYYELPAANCNIMNAKLSYNGALGYDQITQANLAELGQGNNFTNVRLQESMGSSLVFGQVGGMGARWNKFGDLAIDDTACIGPAHGGGYRPGVDYRAAIAFIGNAVTDNHCRTVFAGGAVHQDFNYASHGLVVEGDASANTCDLIMKQGSQWYAPGATGGYTAAPWQVTSSGGIGNNRMSVDGVPVF